jgi:hypothetical protein
MRPIDIGIIQARRARLNEEVSQLRKAILDHQSAIASLETKLADLEIAERVFAELSLEGEGTLVVSSAMMTMEINQEKRGENEESGHPEMKPEGLPAMTTMITEALKHANELGAIGLDPAGMVSYIRGRYWPNAPTQAVGPIAWRMWKREELEKHGSIYTLPMKISDSATNEGVGSEIYKPGDIVLTSGIYQAIHDPPHATPSNHSFDEGRVFPSCRTCRGSARFKLLRARVRVTDEPAESQGIIPC